ncbi:MAG: hypothetical protein CVT90_02865 [Candidatus Altiarchaeales archaeon HGW-Altiarchaeales-3]|nr:MAG: hypothetical protein CVT90_02865 [Candidatus Altiarchaeales archaeon HGW-Altiarchaeales-3]
MYQSNELNDYVRKTIKDFTNDKEIIDLLSTDANKKNNEDDELEIISVKELEPSKRQQRQDSGHRVIVPLPEDIYYILSLYHSGERLTAAEEDMVKNHHLKNEREFINKFKNYLPGVPERNIPLAVMRVMKNYLVFMAKIERKCMQVMFAERIIVLAKIKKKGFPLPPYPSPGLLDFRDNYKRGKVSQKNIKTEIIGQLNLLIEDAEMNFENERKDFYEVINKAFSEISDISSDEEIESAIIKNIKANILENYKKLDNINPAMKTSGALLEMREFFFMPGILEIIIKSENLVNNSEIAPLIKKLEFVMVNLNAALQMGIEDAMNAYKHHVLIYFYNNAREEFK